ncbi:uncharacterized protein LOC114324898 [Diabrotica virgifera virgifera]|uniref:Uncharacterized protein LOC114324898 n=1 Tax=Diabrotica virgifera virgifera TaxID=50390 RepID=A0A6P7EZ98_DIAVI|nr:uncharacterized protein LOC114324898 [Diabrotica virgifera virgifera]
MGTVTILVFVITMFTLTSATSPFFTRLFDSIRYLYGGRPTTTRQSSPDVTSVRDRYLCPCPVPPEVQEDHEKLPSSGLYQSEELQEDHSKGPMPSDEEYKSVGVQESYKNVPIPSTGSYHSIGLPGNYRKVRSAESYQSVGVHPIEETKFCPCPNDVSAIRNEIYPRFDMPEADPPETSPPLLRRRGNDFLSRALNIIPNAAKRIVTDVDNLFQ